MPRLTIRNLDTEVNRRIRLIKTGTSTVDIGVQSGAVFEQSDSVHICLSPSIDAVYDSFYRTMTVTGDSGLNVETKDPNGNEIRL